MSLGGFALELHLAYVPGEAEAYEAGVEARGTGWGLMVVWVGMERQMLGKREKGKNGMRLVLSLRNSR